ncbi:glycosyltransferase [Pseudonocardia spinosispora]|uniref:glycosyltransferase n=1 Tax=Pseudonocardia spinosispora TaxID=103441 RepID=UPI000419C247|nr:glycosyltransferase [Pseudonocardia spinosispora]
MIAYYVHHRGSGHAHRAAAIAAHTRTEIIGLSSAPAPPGWAGRWTRLPDDDAVTDVSARDVTAGGTLHWVPLDHTGLRGRMSRIGEVLAQRPIRLMVTDVSVEVSLLARLHGVPVVVMAQPGDRTDRAHRTAYDLAVSLLAPWPSRPQPDWPREWRDKTVHLGGLSRFDAVTAAVPGETRRVLVLCGSGGLDVTPDDLRAAAIATPDWTWEVAGGPPRGVPGPPNLRWHGWLDQPWDAMSSANIVVTHAGQNAVAEVAAARRPAVVIPQQRPHGEQHATATALRDAGIGVVADRWPPARQWRSLLEQALHRGGHRWCEWSRGDAAARAAAELDRLAE